MKTKMVILQITPTSTWHGPIPEGATLKHAMWHGQRMEVSWDLDGKPGRGFVCPGNTQTRAQFSNMLRQIA